MCGENLELEKVLKNDYYKEMARRKATDTLFNIFLAFILVFTTILIISIVDMDFALFVCKFLFCIIATILGAILLNKFTKIIVSIVVKLLDKYWKDWWKCLSE